MPEPYLHLKDRVSLLGNHHQKYLRSIESHKDRLIGGLEARGEIDQVHLWKPAPDLPAEMAVVLELGSDLDEQLSLFGTYYALQFLHMNLRLVDVLSLNLASAEDRTSVYRDFMIRSGLDFRFLTSNYMGRLLDLFIVAEHRPEFVICGVGSRSDQDDIDVGILDDGPRRRDEFNKAIGRLRHEMLRHASCLHFYLSEHVGTRAYSASILEYRQLLDREIHDFIIITEMLGAAPILGSEGLFDQFKREITWRYHYAPHQDNRYHEAYLRGILGEVRSLLLRHMDPRSIHLKDDGLRMLKSMIYVQKTIFRVDRVNAWDILRALRARDPSRKEVYDEIDRALTFLEIFRHLYNLFVVQEEEVFLNDPGTHENLGTVARYMGYRDVGAIGAWDHLLIHYYENVQSAKNMVAILLDDATKHLKSISVFNSLSYARYPARQAAATGANLAVDFMKMSRFFRGTKFWDDILEELEANEGALLSRFVADFAALDRRFRAKLVRHYGSAGANSFYAFISLLVMLARRRQQVQFRRLFDDLNRAFLQEAEMAEARISKLSKVYSQYPQLINDYLTALNEVELCNFEALLDGHIWESEVARTTSKLRQLIQLHLSKSLYFKRFFLRVIQKYPAYLQYLDDTVKLRQIAKGFLGIIDSLPKPEDKKKTLGDYYDLEYLRVGLNTLQGTGIAVTNAEFTEFSDTYLRTLFEICKQTVDEEIGRKVTTRDLLAFFVAGGHAREQAYDDDLDLLIVLNSNDREMREYCDSIVTRMNADIVKRGTLPQYRFADHYGHYVTLMDELEDLFTRDHPECFIDKSQILGSRMIIGSRKFDKEFEERIIRPYIFDISPRYISRMIQEIQSRHANQSNIGQEHVDLKEGIGGLRDIEMVLLIYKARYRLRQPVNRRLIQTLCEIEPEHREDFEMLRQAFEFLKSVRDLYRLTVSAEDMLRPEFLERPARILGFHPSDTQSATQQLLVTYHACAQKTASTIRKIMEELQLQDHPVA